jgi:hypothetical protein
MTFRPLAFRRRTQIQGAVDSRPLFLCLLLASVPLAAKPVPLVELTADPIPLTRVQLKRGAIDVRVSLGFDKAMLLNLAPAQKLGLKPFPIFGKFKFKNPQIPGGEAIIRGNIVSGDVGGTGKQKLPTVWIDKDVVPPPQAGVVSVMAFDAERVIIRNPSAPTGGRAFVLPRAGRNDSDIKWKLGQDTVRVVFDFTSERTVLNARAAQILEREGLVRRQGRVGLWSPVPALTLPVEQLSPTAGANMMGLPLKEPFARITRDQAKALDARAAAGIQGDSPDDEDAIVVTAKSKEKEGRAPWMLIGRDVLRYCSSVVLDRQAATWTLTCAFPA